VDLKAIRLPGRLPGSAGIDLRTLVLLVLLCAPAPGTTGTPAAGQVPEPSEILGFEPGADYALADVEEIHAYFQRLAATSGRIELEEIGTSTRGRPLYIALISSTEHLRERERHREISERLARARDLDGEEARRLAREGRAIVWINGGQHANEVAHAQHMPELAHWLVTDEGEEARRIREEVITLLMPVLNPDGLATVAEWYERVVGTPYETSPTPVLWHEYVGHDINRDWNALTQAENRAVARVLYREWYPQIVQDHHQWGPFPGRIWVPPAEGPINPHVDPLTITGTTHIGQYLKTRFAAEGKAGVTSGGWYRALWSGGFLSGSAKLRNRLGMFTETALYEYATPHCYEAEEIGDTFTDQMAIPPVSTRDPSIEYPDPWRGGCWRLRDAVEYMLTASRGILHLAARLKEEYLFNSYVMGARQIARAEAGGESPYGYVIDLREQHDPGSAAELLRTLQRGGVELRRAERPFRAGGREHSAGAYVIGPQAFWPAVLDYMEPKAYPARTLYPGGPLDPAGDLTGYALAIQMGVAVHRVEERFPAHELPFVEDLVPTPRGTVAGTGEHGFLLGPEENGATTGIVRLLDSGARVSWAAEPLRAGGRRWPRGTVLVRAAERGDLSALAREFGLSFHGIDRAPEGRFEPLGLPRIAVYRSHVANIREGWLRWFLDSREIPFESLRDRDVRQGALDRFDIVVVPDQSPSVIRSGHAPGSMPEEYVGGLGGDGLSALRDFVEEGGHLLAYGRAVELAIETFELPYRNVRVTRTSGSGPEGHRIPQRIPDDAFVVEGSLIRLEVDESDPLARGMRNPSVATVRRDDVVFDLIPFADERSPWTGQAQVYARYAEKDYLVSGWETGGERYLAGRPAAARIGVGRGRVVVIGFDPIFRGQPHDTFKLLLNPLLRSAVE